MAKTKISEFSVTPGDNTDIDGINIDEGCSPANLNNALRELMSQLKDFQVGNQTSNQLAIAGGGTGATTAADARTNLGLGTMATQAASTVAITGGSIAGITDLALADGGTGASTAADARTNLGLGTIATQSASSVAITGGSITGITDLAIADGGTGASTAADARTNLGLVIGTNVPSPTGTGASGTWGISITGNAATATSATSATSATTATSATNVTGTVAVANGGTGSTSASGARTNLGLAIGSDIPSNTGTGASGTWAINVTGNAATVTNGVYTTGNQTIAGTKTFSSGITFNDSSSQTTAAPTGSWNNVLSSRVKGTTYTNNTGKAIFLSISGAIQANAGANIEVSGVVVVYLAAGGSSVRMQGFTVVPRGATYRLVNNGGDGLEPDQWFEYY